MNSCPSPGPFADPGLNRFDYQTAVMVLAALVARGRVCYAEVVGYSKRGSGSYHPVVERLAAAGIVRRNPDYGRRQVYFPTVDRPALMALLTQTVALLGRAEGGAT